MRRLLASIHDVGPRFEAQVDLLADLATQLLSGPKFAMFVVPDHWGQAPLSCAPHYAAKLRHWADAGVEMFLHGYTHCDDAVQRGFAQRHMTAGEGEFAALGTDAALAKIRDGRRMVEDAIGRPVAGFVAPAWLYSTGAKEALVRSNFSLAEDHWKVWNPRTGAVLTRGPVVTWASRSPGRIRSSLAVARIARSLRAALPTARIAVHPGDTGVPALLDSIGATFSAFSRTHAPSRYGDLPN